MRYAPQSLRQRRGFTLIEMLIVAALITIFSTIAIFSMQQLMESSRRKAAIADLRTVAHTLSAAHIDIGLFPQIGYLGYGKLSEDPIMGIDRSSGTDMLLAPGFDAYGSYESGATPLARRVLAKWQGPYLPNTNPRSVLSYSPNAYTAKMRIPNPNSGEDDEIMAWPCDPWGNPYVCYLLHKPKGYDAWWAGPAEEANFLSIVVSYGRNQIPGGSASGDELSEYPQIRQMAEKYMLFKVDETGAASFVALEPPDTDHQTDPDRYNNDRIFALYHEWGYMDTAPTYVPGILDEEILGTNAHPGSDDIVVPIP